MSKKQNQPTKPAKTAKPAVAKGAAKEIPTGYDGFLRDVKTPIGVASYRLQRKLPAELEQALPAPEEFERLLRE
jgi:hypothetical protein